MALIYQPSKRIFCGWFEPLKSTTYSEYPEEIAALAASPDIQSGIDPMNALWQGGDGLLSYLVSHGLPYTFPYTATAKGDIMRQSMAKYGMTSERTPVMINGNLHS